MSIEVGNKLQGKVTGITNFGAFVELPDGITGLVHISEVAGSYVKDINDHLKVGDVVEVKVLNVEKGGKIGLSIKQAQVQPPPTQMQRPQQRPRSGDRGGDRGGNRGNNNSFAQKETLDQQLNRFLKDSEDRLTSLKRHTESKRGGRGGRRG